MGTKEGKSAKKTKPTKRKRSSVPKKKDLKTKPVKTKKKSELDVLQMNTDLNTGEVLDSFNEVTETIPLKIEKPVMWCPKREYRIFMEICPYYVTKICKKLKCSNYDNGMEEKKRKKREGVVFSDSDDDIGELNEE